MRGYRAFALKLIVELLVLLGIFTGMRAQAAGPAPVILVQPLSASVLFMGTTTLTVVASSGTTMTYQWFKNGVALTNATSSFFTILNAQSTDQGSYVVKITNAGGSVTSAVSTVSILAPPSITADPQSAMLSPGGSTTLSVSAVGMGTLTYRWVLNGNTISGATTSALAITNAQPANAGSYYAVVDNSFGSTTSAVAYVNIQDWVRTYDGKNKDDYTIATATDNQGNVYVTGYAQQNSGGPNNYVTLKYNNAGQVQWTASYDSGKSQSDIPSALAVDAAGNVYVTGASQMDPANGGWSYATIKYDANGNQLWVARYNGPGNKEDAATALAVDASGNVYVTGKSKNSSDKYDYATVKYDAAGNQVWAARYAYSAATEDDATAIVVDDSGNVYVTGQSKGGTDFDYATIKYDRDGNQLWVARYDGPAGTADQAAKIALDKDLNVIVAGSSKGTGSDFDYAVVKYDNAGNQLWVARYNGPANKIETLTGLAIDSTGNVLVTGSSEASPGTSYFATVKYSSAGTQLWAQRYDFGADDEATGIALDAWGDVYVTGSSRSSNYDFATLKYRSADGTQLWAYRYNTGKDDYAVAVTVDNAFNVFVCGEGNDKLDFTLIKYSTGLFAPAITEHPKSFRVPTGSNVCFTVSACGTYALGYQWYLNGARIAGATNSSLNVSSVDVPTCGSYTVTVTNSLGSTVSQTAMLSLQNFHPSLAASSASASGPGPFSFQISAYPGATCVIEASADMQTWTPISTNIASSASVTFTDNVSVNFGKRFYRAAIR